MVRIILFSLIFSILSACNQFNAQQDPIASSSGETPVEDIHFSIGVFEDANLLGGDQARFRTMIADLVSHGLDAVMFANNFAQRDAALLDVSDELEFSVYMTPGGDLNETWWPSDIPADERIALQSAEPIVSLWKSHPSLKGYITKDEPGLHDLDKVRLITQTFQSLDSTRLAMPILIGVDRVGPIFAAAQPDVMLIDVYPAGASNPACDLTMTGFGYKNYDFVSYIRAVTQNKPPSTPLWIILQTHNFLDQLREPTYTEVREQFWLAIGEGAKGIFWFVYSSQQGWTGLADNPALYAEVTSLARRINPLRPVLQRLQKVEDRFSVSGLGSPRHYVSTLKSTDQRIFVVAVNKDCQSAQNLTITSVGPEGRLMDLETSTIHELGAPVWFPAGDGRIFEVVADENGNLEH